MYKQLFVFAAALSSLVFIPNEALFGMETEIEQDYLQNLEVDGPQYSLRNHSNTRRCCFQNRRGHRGPTGATGATGALSANNAFSESQAVQSFNSPDTPLPAKVIFPNTSPPFIGTGITFDSINNDFILPVTGRYLVNVAFTGFFFDPAVPTIGLSGLVELEFLLNNTLDVGHLASPSTSASPPSDLSIFSLSGTFLVNAAAGDRLALAVSSITDLSGSGPISFAINTSASITIVQVE